MGKIIAIWKDKNELTSEHSVYPKFIEVKNIAEEVELTKMVIANGWKYKYLNQKE